MNSRIVILEFINWLSQPFFSHKQSLIFREEYIELT